MKNLLTVLIIFLFALNLPAQQWLDEWQDEKNKEIWSTETMTINEWEGGEKFHEDWKAYDTDEEEFNLEIEENKWMPEQGKKPFHIPKRVFEFGLLELDVGVAQNLKTDIFDYFKKKLLLDFTNFNSDFDVGFDLFLRPIYWNVNIKNNWGMGMDIGKVSVYGNVSLAEELLHFKKTPKSGVPFGAGAAAFVDVGFPVFFSIKNVWEDRKLKINVRPAGFVTALYAEPKMKFTNVDVKNHEVTGSKIEVDFGVKAYAPFSLENPDNILSNLDINEVISEALGFDFSLGADFPLFDWIDVGVKFINIPLSPSRLKHYIEIIGKGTVDTSIISFEDLIDGKFPNDIYYFPEEIVPQYGKESGHYVFFRPFKMLLTADFYPLYFLNEMPNRYLILSPVLGFSINTLFVQPAAIEVGLKVSTDLANMFIPSISFFYEDQMWKNKFDFAFNLRAFQLNLGVAMQSQDFLKSWTGAGLRVNVGLIFGW